jgi:cytidyltransferase-like protein
MTKKVVLVTGGFDPIHSGHIAHFKEAKKLGDELIVGINSDAWLTRKKGNFFMPMSERLEIISNLGVVDRVVPFTEDMDIDNSSRACIRNVLNLYPDAEIIYANGGDRTKVNIPEMDIQNARLSFAFSVGGDDKKNSSSWILENWKNAKTQRLWGWYRVLDDKTTYKVKELVIEPGKSLSMQRHFHRNEHWYVLKGSCVLDIDDGDKKTVHLNENSSYVIEKKVWHRGNNVSNELCHILEVQYGDVCVEEDIERK